MALGFVVANDAARDGEGGACSYPQAFGLSEDCGFDLGAG
jgi:hypothetical protein